MSSSIASTHLFSLLSWAFLPALLSRFLLTTYYRLLPSSRPTISPTSPPAEIAHQNSRAQAHSRNARVLLIGLYLAYTILSTYFAQSQGTARNFYTLLGINRTVVENEGAQAVKSHWRKLARLYHPDKIGKAGEQYFVELRRGVECLEDEGKRWAYERFGPVVLEWGKMKGNREWLVRGAYQSVVFYVFAFLSIWLLSIVRKEERANGFWRYTALLITLSTEFSILFRSTPSPLFAFLLPHRLPYEHIALLRQFFISTSMALSQLAPLLFPTPPALPGSPAEQAFAQAQQDALALKPLLDHLARLAALSEVEAIKLQQLEIVPLCAAATLRPVEGEAEEDKFRKAVEVQDIVLEALKDDMVESFIDLRLRGEADGQRMWSDAVLRGSGTKPVGAGTASSKTIELPLPTASTTTPPSPSPPPILLPLSPSLLPPTPPTLHSPPSSPPPKSLPLPATPPSTLPTATPSTPSPLPLLPITSLAASAKAMESAGRLPSPPPEGGD